MRSTHQITRTVLLATAALALLGNKASYADDRALEMFLNLGAEIPGDSTSPTHPDQIVVFAWSWGVVNQGTAATGSGGGAGKASFRDLRLTKLVDRSTPKLFLACASGKHIPKATLTIRKAGGTQEDFLVINLEDVLVTSVESGGTTQDLPSEQVSFSFGKVQLKYHGQSKASGSDKPVIFSWDLLQSEGS